MDDRGKTTLRQQPLRYGIDLGTIETRSKNGELVRADIEPVRICAYERLVRETWTAEMGRRARGTVVRGVNRKDVVRTSGIRASAYRDVKVRTTSLQPCGDNGVALLNSDEPPLDL